MLLYIVYKIHARAREREKEMQSEHDDLWVALSLHPHFIGILLKSIIIGLFIVMIIIKIVF